MIRSTTRRLAAYFGALAGASADATPRLDRALKDRR